MRLLYIDLRSNDLMKYEIYEESQRIRPASVWLSEDSINTFQRLRAAFVRLLRRSDSIRN